MNRNLTIMIALVLSASANVFSATPAEQTPVQAVKEESGVTFDAAVLTYSFGNKKLVFRKGGVCQVFSGKKVLGSTYFYIGTPYSGWMTNQSAAPVEGEYNGKGMRVTEIKTEGNKVTFIGKVPWNKKGEPVVAGDWQVVVEPVAKGKIKVEWSYIIPEGQKRKDDAVFMSLKNCKLLNAGSIGTWIPGKTASTIRSGKLSTLTMEGGNEEDTYRIETALWHIQAPELRINSKKGKVSMVFDFNPVMTN